MAVTVSQTSFQEQASPNLAGVRGILYFFKSAVPRHQDDMNNTLELRALSITEEPCELEAAIQAAIPALAESKEQTQKESGTCLDNEVRRGTWA